MLLGRPDGFYFDPLRVATDANFARLREAELKHGRIAMLANLGVEVPPLFQILLSGRQQDLDWVPLLSSSSSSSSAAYYSSILENISNMKVLDFAQIGVTCAFLELFVFIQRDPKDMPGDYGTGYLGIRDKGLHERSLISELENGRLAMLALVAQVIAELVTGKDYIEQWHLIWEQIQKQTTEGGSLGGFS